MKIKVLFFLFWIVFVFACSDSDLCKENTESVCYIQLYDKTKEENLELDSVYITNYPIPGNIIYVSYGNPFGVNLNPDSDSTGFMFRIFDSDTSWTDTIEIYYTSELKLISYACGFSHFYLLDTIITYSDSINSSEILFENVFNYEAEHIKLFY